jgi:preprotein translocase subunit SecF
MKYRWQLFALSMALVGLAIYFWAVRGLNYGTDFKGGLSLVYQFNSPTTEGAVTDALQKANLPSFVVQRFGEFAKNTFVVKSDVVQKTEEKFSAPFTGALEQAYGPGQVTLAKEEFVGPKVGKELRTKGVYAVFWAWMIMLVYIGFRFDFYFAPGAIVALIHDVLIAVAAFAVTGLEVNLTVVAAILTIIGYSINDTIVVFDRIRENLQKHKGMDLVALVDLSINETLVRTLITSIAVLFVSLVLFFRAEGDIQNFGFAMIFGVLTGTYSSVFIASPIFIFLKQHGHRLGFKKTKAGTATPRTS